MEDVNLNAMLTIQKEFGVSVGYSDHTLGIEVDIAAVAMGASVIEKHFTYNKKLKGNDHYHSMDFIDLREFVNKLVVVRELLGTINSKKCLKEELISRKNARRSIYTSRKIYKGEILNENNMQIVRPNLGLHPREFKNVLGKRIIKDVLEGTPLSQDLLDN